MPLIQHPLRKHSRPMGSLLSLALLLAVIPEPLTAGAPAPDANTIVKKMVTAYKKATSIQDFAEATFATPGVSTYIQSSRLKWKSPNLIYFHSQDPRLGTLSMHSNGNTITLYMGKQNLFTRRNTTAKLQDTLVLADKASQESFGFQNSQILSPLSFMLSNGMPREASSFRYAGQTTLDGQRVHKVTALADLRWAKAMVPNAVIEPAKREIVLWIDVKTNLLKKASGYFTWKVISVNKERLARPLAGGFRFEETHRDTILNAPIPDEEFRFTPPKGAKQLFQERS